MEPSKSQYSAKIYREMPDCVDKVKWKQDICKYTEKAFELYSSSLLDIAKYINSQLDLFYENKRWVVFVYEFPGDALVWYYSGYCCEIECVNLVKKEGPRYYVAIKHYMNEGYLLTETKYNNMTISDKNVPIILAKGNKITEKVFLEAISRIFDSKPSDISLKILQDVLGQNKLGIGTDWGVCKCKNGAISCCLIQDEYVIFQYKEFVYLCFRQF